MKIKRFILPGILLILAGIFCFTAVLWKHGWDPMRLTSTKYTGRVAKYENVQTIYIEDRNSPIFIKSHFRFAEMCRNLSSLIIHQINER